jgi:hypothetical protein
MATPRGIRNHNPGNIDHNPRTKWQGLATPPSDGRFCRFVSAAFGIRALARVLITYQDQHDLDTVRGIINRWAPPVENDTAAYVGRVAVALGVGPDDPIDVHQHAVMRPLVAAIIRHENGVQPYTVEQLDEGLRLAGVVGKPKPIAARKESIGGYLGSAGFVGETLTSSANQLQVVSEYSTILHTVFTLLLVGGIALSIYAGIANRRREAVA